MQPGIEPSLPREQLARTLAQLPTAVALLAGPEHVYVAASESYLRIAGKPVLGRSYREAFPELEGQGFFELMDEVYATGQPWSARGAPAAWDEDGDGAPEPHYIDVTFAPVRDEDGAVEAITLTVEVVDERIAAEQARERAVAEAETAREHLTRVIAQAPVAMYIARGREHVFEVANEPWYAIAGKRPDEVIGRPVRDVFPELVPQGIIDVIENVYDSGRPFSTEAYPLTFDADGDGVPEEHFFNVVYQALRDASGAVYAVATVATEVTDLVNARRTAERLQSLTAALSRALTTDEVGNAAMNNGVRALQADAGVLALLSPAGDELEVVASTGYPAEACVAPGRTWKLDTTIPIAEATRIGKPVCIGSPEEWGHRYPGGYAPTHSRSAAWAAFPIELAGQPTGALLWTYTAPRSFTPDETTLMETLARLCSQALERVRLLETEQRARAEAEEANRSKTEFLSAMSHELRTPLNAIAGYVDLLDAEVRGPLTDLQRMDLQRIKRAQEVLLSLINDVLNFARLEAGRLKIVCTVVSVTDLLHELEDLMGNQIRARGLSLEFEPCPDDLVVLGDAERIRQILMNLLSNAIKFTEPGGRISISAGVDQDRAWIWVSDTGSGIPADRVEAIFEPFVQIDRRQLEESQQGVGLGLAISRELARAMGGDLDVRSRVGEGSTFSLTLPTTG